MNKTSRLAMNIVILIFTLLVVIVVEDRTVNLYQIKTPLLIGVTMISYSAFAYLVIERKKTIGVLFIGIPFLYIGGTILSVVMKYNPVFTIISGELMGLAIITCYPLIIWGILEQRYQLAIITFYIFSAIQFTLFYFEQRITFGDLLPSVVALIVLTIVLYKKNINYNHNNAVFEMIIQELYGDILTDIHIKKENGIIKIRGMSDQMLVEITDDGALHYCMHFSTDVMRRIVYTKRTKNIQSLSYEQNSIFMNYATNFTSRKGIIIEPNLLRINFIRELGYHKLLSSLNYKKKISLYNSQLTAAMKLTQVL